MEDKVTEVTNSEKSYKVLPDKLGKGSYGTVFKGELLKSSQKIAVKCIVLNNVITKTECRKEVALMREFAECKYVIQLIEACVEEDSAEYEIAMELAQCSLQELMEHVEFIHGLSEDVMKDLIHDSTEGLTEVHSKKIGLRDIKPDNMLVFPGYGNKRFSKFLFKYSDFGLSKKGSKFSTLVGTPCYMAPPLAEVLIDNHNARGGDKLQNTYSRATDLWSLGCTIVESTMGKIAFPDPKCFLERKEHPRAIRATIKKKLNREGTFIYHEDIDNKTYSPWFKVFVEILARLMFQPEPSLESVRLLVEKVLSIETSTMIVLKQPNICKMFTYADLTKVAEFEDDWSKILHTMFQDRPFYALSELDVIANCEKNVFDPVPGQDYVILKSLDESDEAKFINLSTLKNDFNYSDKLSRNEILFRATTYNNEADTFSEMYEKLLEIVKNNKEAGKIPNLKNFLKQCKLEKKVIANIQDDLNSLKAHDTNQEGLIRKTALYTEQLHEKCQERHKAVHEQFIEILNGTKEEIGLFHYLQKLAQKLNELNKPLNAEGTSAIEIPDWMRKNADQIKAFYMEKNFDEELVKKTFNLMKDVPVGITLNPPVTHL